MRDPLISVVAAIVSDTTGAAGIAHLRPALKALVEQEGKIPIEIIVPYHQNVSGIEEISREFPQVRLLPVTDLTTYTGQPGSREHHDELRARGIAEARGEIIALLEDHGRVSPTWAREAVRMHSGPWAGVGGAIENGIDRPLNWAVYFCDFLRYQNPLPEGPSPFASDANVAYKRSALETIRPVWQRIFHETAVNSALRANGLELALCPSMVVTQNRLHLRFGSALGERYIWGRSYAGTRSRLIPPAKRFVLAAISPALPALILGRMALKVFRGGRGVRPFLTALPLTTLLTVSWCMGEMIGYLTGAAAASGTPAADALAGKSTTA